MTDFTTELIGYGYTNKEGKAVFVIKGEKI
jgi:hypothetical protein